MRVERARQRKRGLTDRIWALLVLELWFRMWIDPAEPVGMARKTTMLSTDV